MPLTYWCSRDNIAKWLTESQFERLYIPLHSGLNLHKLRYPWCSTSRGRDRLDSEGTDDKPWKRLVTIGWSRSAQELIRVQVEAHTSRHAVLTRKAARLGFSGRHYCLIWLSMAQHWTVLKCKKLVYSYVKSEDIRNARYVAVVTTEDKYQTTFWLLRTACTSESRLLPAHFVIDLPPQINQCTSTNLHYH